MSSILRNSMLTMADSGSLENADFTFGVGENILPPFDSGEWVNRSANPPQQPQNVNANGYQVTFTSNNNASTALMYVPTNPQQFNGQTMTLSIEDLRRLSGDAGVILIEVMINSITLAVMRTDQVHNNSIIFTCPAVINTMGIHVQINVGHVNGTVAFFKNPSLVIGGATTPQFRPRFDVNADSGGGVRFTPGRVLSARAPLAGQTHNHLEFEVDFTMPDTLQTSNVTIVRIDSVFGLQTRNNAQLTGLFGFGEHTWDSDNSILRVNNVLQVNRRYVAKIVFNNGRQELWLDNVLIASRQATGAIRASGNQMQVGSAGVGFSQNFNGIIHSCRLTRDGFDLINYDFTNQNIDSTRVIDTATGNHGVLQGNAEWIGSTPDVDWVQGENVWRGGMEWGHLQNSTGNWIGIEQDPNQAQGNRTTTFFRVQPNTRYRITGVFNRILWEIRNAQGQSVFFGINQSTNTTAHTSITTLHDTVEARVYFHQGDNPPTQLPQIVIERPQNQLRLNQMLRGATKNYPFTFTRNSTGVGDGLLFGNNEPRIMSMGRRRGIAVEEGAENLMTINNFENVAIGGASVDGWRLHAGGGLNWDWRVEDGILHVRGQQVQGGASTGGLRILSPLIPIDHTQVTVMTFKARNNGTVGASLVNVLVQGSIANGMPSGQLNGQMQRFNLGDGWFLHRWIINPNALLGQAGNQAAFIWNSTWQATNGAVLDVSIKEWQVEQMGRNFHTSFQPHGAPRQREQLQIPNPARFFDNVRGSLELELTPISGDNVHAGGDTNNTRNDLTWNTGGGWWIIRRNHTGINQIGTVFHDAINVNHTFIWRNGDRIRYRIAWDREQNFTRLYANEQLITQVNHLQAFTNVPMFIGSRSGTAHSSGNAIYHNLIIRDRFGRIAYDLSNGIENPV